MAALPITGWIVNAAANIPLRIYGLIPLPAIVAPDKALQGGVTRRPHRRDGSG